MTTKRIIEIYNDYDRISGILIRGNGEEETKFNCETIEVMNNINVILHKYQKIEQIVERWACCGNPSDSMIAIGEVIEDGADTTNTGSN